MVNSCKKKSSSPSTARPHRPRRKPDVKPAEAKSTAGEADEPAVDSLEPALQKAAERVRGLLVEIGVDGTASGPSRSWRTPSAVTPALSTNTETS
jgi:hypothetical protein